MTDFSHISIKKWNLGYCKRKRKNLLQEEKKAIAKGQQLIFPEHILQKT